MADLPLEIIERILLLVPVRSLHKFKRVSKGWASLINSEYFIKAHLEVSKRNTSLQMVLCSRDNGFIKCCSLSSLLSAQVDGCDIPSPLKDKDFNVVGACNGIICIRTWGCGWDFWFWNPATGYLKRLPNWIGEKEVPYGFQGYGVGFGFDELSSDYKVVVILIAPVSGKNYEYDIQSHVYSSKQNVWRQILEFSHPNTVVSSSGAFYRGKLHWLGYRVRLANRLESSIVSFNLSTDAFERTFVPPETFVKNVLKRLRVANERLYIISQSVWREPTDFWILQQHGGRGDWERVVRVDFDRIHFPIAHPFYLGENCDLLFWGESRILMHDSKDMTVKEVADFGPRRHCSFGALFVESLVRDI